MTENEHERVTRQGHSQFCLADCNESAHNSLILSITQPQSPDTHRNCTETLIPKLMVVREKTLGKTSFSVRFPARAWLVNKQNIQFERQ